MLLFAFSNDHCCLPDNIAPAVKTSDAQPSSSQPLQPTITPGPDLCPGCRLAGGFARILEFPSSDSVAGRGENSTIRDPFFTEEIFPFVTIFGNGSDTTSFSTRYIPVPSSLSNLSDTDTIFSTQRVWSQFGTQL